MADDYYVDDNPYFSDIRAWVHDTLGTVFPVDETVICNKNKCDSRFTTYTGHTFESLVKKWKTSPGYTTCADFLTLINTYLCTNQGISVRSGARWGFVAFGLNSCGANGLGWHHRGEIDQGAWPESGDFYQIGTGAKTAHVGVVLEVNGTRVTYISGGGGTPGMDQSIIRVSNLIFPPDNLLGWLNIDEYYGSSS